MCGIAGIIKIHHPSDGPPPPPLEAIPEVWLDTLDESIKHRGPDGQGRFRDRAIRDDGTIVDVALVHRRLSIIDHEGGHQPMVHDCERLRTDLTYQPGETPIIASEIEPTKPLVAVVFNGCIYNHRGLRKELEKAGHVFETDHSDTEVLVHGWREWGTDVFTRLQSMHGIAIWDRSSVELTASRDRFGEKPVYECESAKRGCSIFSSTVPGMAALIGYTLDRSQIVEWIAMGQDPLQTPIEGICQMPPATCIGLSTRETQSLGLASSLGKKVHRSFRITEEKYLTASQAADLIDQHIESAVKDRLTADVDLACFLSGGLDSSLIALAAQRVLSRKGERLHTICVRMPDPKFDESVTAREVAQIIGSEHHEVEASAHPAADLVFLIESLGLPFGDSSLLPSHWVSQAAQMFAGVAIGGDGGDEIFLGYERQVAAGDLVPLGFLSLVTLNCPPRLLPRSKTNRWDKAARMLIASSKRSYRSLLAIHQHPDLHSLMPYAAHLCRWDDRANSARLAQTYDFDHYLPGDLLRKIDTASMVCPIEMRSPLLDTKLCAFSRSLPLKTLRNAERHIITSHPARKGLLKQVARKYLPDHIVDRPKQGFAIPIGEWFRSDFGSMRQLLHDHMNSTDPFPGLGESGVEINMDFVRQMMREHDAAGEKSINPWHGRDHSQRLYMMLVLSIWAKWLDRVRSQSVEGV